MAPNIEAASPEAAYRLACAMRDGVLDPLAVLGVTGPDESVRLPRIYFIRMEAPVRRRPIKIGYSTRPDGRRMDLLTVSPYPVTLLAAFPAALLPERALHREFASDRMQGEWHLPSAPMLRLIRELQGVQQPIETTDEGDDPRAGMHFEKANRCVATNQRPPRGRCGQVGSIEHEGAWYCLAHPPRVTRRRYGLGGAR